MVLILLKDRLNELANYLNFKSNITTGIFFLLATIVFGQKKINNTFVFEDGFYMSYASFKNNLPDAKLFELKNFSYYLDGQKNILVLNDEAIGKLAQSKIGSIDSLWGMCVKGIPYRRVTIEKDSISHYFVKLHVIGDICYYYYPSIVDKEVEMQVYNPFNGEQVGRKTITNKEKKLLEKIFKFKDGQIVDFTPSNFKMMIQDDERVLKTFRSLRSDEMDQKLFKLLNIYNDRHPVLIEQ